MVDKPNLFAYTLVESENKEVSPLGELPVIGLDFDGVIVDTARHRSEVCSLAYGRDIPAVCFAARTVVSGGHLTQQEHDHLMNLVFADPQYAARMAQLPGAISAIRSLVRPGLVFKVVTMRQEESVRFARRFLDNQRLDDIELIATDRVRNKHLYTGGMLAFVEDRTEHLEGMKESVPNLFLIDPYEVAEPVNWYTIVNGWFALRPILFHLSIQHRLHA